MENYTVTSHVFEHNDGDNNLISQTTKTERH